MPSMVASIDWTVDRPAAASDSTATGFDRSLAFAVGLLPAPLWMGVAEPMVLDLLGAGGVAVLAIRHRVARIPDAAAVFLAAIGLSLIPALMVTPGPMADVWRAFGATILAFAFYAAGLVVGGSPALTKSLLAGLCAGVFAEVALRTAGRPSFGTSAPWALCAAGLLWAFGPSLASSRFRWVAAAAAAAAAALACLSPAGLAAVVVGAGLIGLASWRSTHARSLKAAFGSAAALLLLLGMLWPQAASAAFEGAGARAGVIRDQLRLSWTAVEASFPFGSGVGRADGAPNGIAAILMEFGALGLAGFLALAALSTRGAVRGAAAVVVAGVVLMFHEPMHRDRSFFLLLGLTAATALFRRDGVEKAVV